MAESTGRRNDKTEDIEKNLQIDEKERAGRYEKLDAAHLTADCQNF